MQGVASALHYLDTQGLIYRELRPKNIFLQYGGFVKLGELSYAVSKESEQESGASFLDMF